MGEGWAAGGGVLKPVSFVQNLTLNSDVYHPSVKQHSETYIITNNMMKKSKGPNGI